MAAARWSSINQKSEALQDQVFKLIGPRCVALSTAVAELHLLMRTQYGVDYWKKEHSGVVCFVKDNPRRSFFIMVIDLEQKAIVWEYELFFRGLEFNTTSTAPNFYIIVQNEGQTRFGFNFSDIAEAQNFVGVIKKKIEERKQKRILVRTYTNTMQQLRASRAPSLSLPSPTGQFYSSIGDAGPLDHKNIVQDSRWQMLFQHAGVTENQLNDEETLKFIFDFVNSHGGITKATSEFKQVGSSSFLSNEKERNSNAAGSSSKQNEIPSEKAPRKNSGDWRVKQLDSWTVEDVCDWLKDISLEEYCELFRFHAIDGVELMEQNESLVDALKIERIGHRRKIIRNLSQLLDKENEDGKNGQEKAKNNERSKTESGPPDELLCPITQELMTDPVIVADGYTYERTSITQWFETGNHRSPMTNLPLKNKDLVPNRSLKDAINRHLGD
eukprot:TCONS_00016347-protein